MDESIATRIEVLSVQMISIKEAIDELKSRRKEDRQRDQIVYDLKVAVGELKTQLKITWALLAMVIGGMVAQAMAYWSSGGGIP